MHGIYSLRILLPSEGAEAITSGKVSLVLPTGWFDHKRSYEGAIPNRAEVGRKNTMIIPYLTVSRG